jgi:hypothetical protein
VGSFSLALKRARLPQRNTQTSSLLVLVLQKACSTRKLESYKILCNSKLLTEDSSQFCNMATRQDLPYLLDSKSECPPLFNGTTRLYYFPVSPFSQCVKIALNYKGLDEIECLPISLNDKPTWYVEKVYPVGKVPALEHNGKVKGESLDLLVYIDQEFGGPNMTPTVCIPNFIYIFMLRLLNEFCKLEFSSLSCTKIFVVVHNKSTTIWKPIYITCLIF